MSRSHKRIVIIVFCSLLLILTAGCQESTVAPPKQNDESQVTESSLKTVTDKVVLFGIVETVQGAEMTVFIPPPIDPNENPHVLWSEVLPGQRVTNRSLKVIITPNTSVDHHDGEWFELETGSPVMMAGELIRGELIARFISDPRDLEIDPNSMPNLPTVPTLEDGPPLQLPIPADLLPDLPTSNSSTTDPSETYKNFPGKFGGPAKAFNSGHLGIPVYTTLLRTVFIERIRPIIGLAGGRYKFPFTFVAEELNTLVVGQEGDLQIQVVHEKQNGEYSYYWALGGVLNVTFKYCDLEWGGWDCETFTHPIGFLSSVSATEDAAPLKGKKLDVPHDACPGFGFGIPGTELNIASIDVCTDQSFIGDYFNSHVSIYGYRNFDLDPEKFRTIPHTNPLKFEMRDFRYIPDWNVGYSLQLSVLTVPLYDTPTIVEMNAGTMSFIPTGDQDCGTFNMLTTCGDEQPTSVTLELPTIPVVTWVTALPYPSRYGDVMRLQAFVDGANGPGDSPREVHFYDGDTHLATVPIDETDLATFEISSLEPCRHIITAKYVGVDSEGITYPSEKSVVAIVTGDSDRSRLEGYWQHQCLGVGNCDYDMETMECYLSIVGEMSQVFHEARDISTGAAAHDVLFLGSNLGSALEQLDRELLVTWLNFANGAFRYYEMLDTDKDHTLDTPFHEVMETAEMVRMDPGSTKRQLKEQTQILHHIKDMVSSLDGSFVDDM